MERVAVYLLNCYGESRIEGIKSLLSLLGTNTHEAIVNEIPVMVADIEGEEQLKVVRCLDDFCFFILVDADKMAQLSQEEQAASEPDTSAEDKEASA